MTLTASSKSREIRTRVGHPIIDADGHMVEFGPPLEDYVRKIGGSDYAVQFVGHPRRWGKSDEDRLANRQTMLSWWVPPTVNTLDRATVQLPKLLHERMPELGLDYAVLYGTFISRTYNTKNPKDPDAARIGLRAANTYKMDMYREFADRLTPAIGVSMATPQTALDDLNYAVDVLGAKVINIQHVWRPNKPIWDKYPDIGQFNFGIFDYRGMWTDNFGIDSPYDYDPFWKACLEKKVAITGHGTALGFTTHASPTNHCYNHLGAFAEAGEALCKALFFGGVTRRFPNLKIALLEGGVSTGARIYCDLFSHWEKRGAKGIQNCNPAHLDHALFTKLNKQYGGRWVESKADRILSGSAGGVPEDLTGLELDDFARCGITKKEDIRDLFVPHFFFGCEADDPMNKTAFDRKMLPFGVHLNAIFSSDMGHWDVPDMSEMVEEAYELVEKELINEEDFKEFTFTNAVKFFAGSNPDFFKGTAIESEVNRAIKAGLK